MSMAAKLYTGMHVTYNIDTLFKPDFLLKTSVHAC